MSPSDPTAAGEALTNKARELLDVALAYWSVADKHGVRGAVKWLTGSDGALVIVTRGEYRETLMQNIDQLGGSPLSFGASDALAASVKGTETEKTE